MCSKVWSTKPIGAASDACDVNIDPSRVVVRFGDPVTVNCSTTREGVLEAGWESSVSPVNERDSKIAVWNVSSLTVWDAEPKCFINYMKEPRQCVEKLDLVIYKYPESVSLIAPDFMKIGVESNITCQVLDVAPIRYLSVKLYKGDEQLGNRSFTHNSTRFPVNESVPFPVTPTRADNGAEYTCVAELQLELGEPIKNSSLPFRMLPIDFEEQPILTVSENVEVNQPSTVRCELKNAFPPEEVQVELLINNESHTNISTDMDNVYVEESFTLDSVEPAVITCNVSLRSLSKSASRNVQGYDEPSVINPAVESVLVLNGDSVVFNCTADGIPAPTYTWKHPEADNVKITTKDSVSTVTITGASPNNNGVYECQAWNIHGNSTRKVTVEVTEHPESVSLIAPDFMKIGVESSITCQVLDVAPIRYLSVKLYKGDEQLGNRSFTHDSTRFPVNESVPFPVTPTREDNGAEYTCVAELQLGPGGPKLNPTKRSPPLKIPVVYKPSLLSADEENVEVREGGSIVLKCSADGSPAPTYEWKYPKADNVQEITKDGVSTVNITRASSSNARVYECHAKNTYGVATKNITLTVKGASSSVCDVNIDPSRVVVRFGDPVTVNCSTTREDVLGSGWESSVSPVNEPDSKITVWNVSSLTVWDAEPKCFINYMNEPRQCVEKLDLVIYKYPESVSLIAPEFMKIGEESNITCQVLDVAPIRYLSVKLYKGDEQLGNRSFTHDSTRFPVNESVPFPVTPTRADNGAEYTCVAELQLGPGGPKPNPAKRSPPLKIPVIYKPSLLSAAEENVEVREGGSIVLKCSADGNPAPTYEWKYHKADNVQEIMKDGVSTVNITRASSSNARVYECHAKNTYGVATKNITLTVKGGTPWILIILLIIGVVLAIAIIVGGIKFCRR
ncbi:UNVERIFIED_CONTAM: hypothetical protein FKN15_058620 [Acipenser sinensis]